MKRIPIQLLHPISNIYIMCKDLVLAIYFKHKGKNLVNFLMISGNRPKPDIYRAKNKSINESSHTTCSNISKIIQIRLLVQKLESMSKIIIER